MTESCCCDGNTLTHLKKSFAKSLGNNLGELVDLEGLNSGLLGDDFSMFNSLSGCLSLGKSGKSRRWKEKGDAIS